MLRRKASDWAQTVACLTCYNTCWLSEIESWRWCLRWREASHRKEVGGWSIKSPAARYNSSFLAQRSTSPLAPSNCKSCNSSQDQASFSSRKLVLNNLINSPPVPICPHEQPPYHLFPSSCFSLCRSAVGMGGILGMMQYVGDWQLSTSGPFMDI